jgi:hypothetical protein
VLFDLYGYWSTGIYQRERDGVFWEIAQEGDHMNLTIMKKVFDLIWEIAEEEGYLSGFIDYLGEAYDLGTHEWSDEPERQED